MIPQVRLLLLALPLLFLAVCDLGETVQAVPNNAPVFTSNPVDFAFGYAGYTYDITADDADADTALTIGAATLPSWLALTDSGDGAAVLTGIPGNDDLGDHPVVLTLTDGVITAPVTQSFTITVNIPPVIFVDLTTTRLSSFPHDPITIVGGEIKLDTLHLVVEYSGGCQEHAFGLVTRGFTYKTNPASGKVWLLHDAKGDTCQDNISKDLYFNFTPVREWCLQVYEDDPRVGVAIVDLNHWLNYLLLDEENLEGWGFLYQVGDTSSVILEPRP